MDGLSRGIPNPQECGTSPPPSKTVMNLTLSNQQGWTETLVDPWADTLFMAISALFKQTLPVVVGSLKWWAPGHCPIACRLNPPMYRGLHAYRVPEWTRDVALLIQ